MPSQSRKELLTDMERERLTTPRDEIDNKTRGMNDARVKRKLAAWIQNFDDVKLILDNLPEDHLNAVLSDEDVYKLFKLTEKLISIRGFSPIEGRIHEERWIGFRGEVADLDIWRSYNVYQHLMRVFDYFGHRNPFWDNYHLLEGMVKDEEFKDRVSPEERKGMERIQKAIRAYQPKIRATVGGSHDIPPEE